MLHLRLTILLLSLTFSFVQSTFDEKEKPELHCVLEHELLRQVFGNSLSIAESDRGDLQLLLKQQDISDNDLWYEFSCLFPRLIEARYLEIESLKYQALCCHVLNYTEFNIKDFLDEIELLIRFFKLDMSIEIMEKDKRLTKLMLCLLALSWQK